jgi:hypothetical protein
MLENFSNRIWFIKTKVIWNVKFWAGSKGLLYNGSHRTGFWTGLNCLKIVDSLLYFFLCTLMIPIFRKGTKFLGEFKNSQIIINGVASVHYATLSSLIWPVGLLLTSRLATKHARLSYKLLVGKTFFKVTGWLIIESNNNKEEGTLLQ